MNYNSVFSISSAGMSAERTRVDISALNLANANTVQVAGGDVYQPLRVVARAGNSFAGSIEQAFSALPQVSVEPTGLPARMVYEPGHPFANERGFIAYPGVDVATEMVTMMSAMRSYEANVAAMNAARNMAIKALDIGGA